MKPLTLLAILTICLLIGAPIHGTAFTHFACFMGHYGQAGGCRYYTG